MNGFLQKQAGGFYVSALSVILAVASMISYAVLATDGEKTPFMVYVLTVAAVVITIVVLAWNQTQPGRKYYNTSSFFAALLYAVSLVVFFMGRMEWIGGLAAHNANFAPMHMSFYVTVALYVVTMLLSIIGSFMKVVKEQG